MDEKKKRTACLGKFTRNFNLLIQGIDGASLESLVTPQYEKVKECWLKLEDAHDDFLAATDIEDIDTDPEGVKYMDTPSKNYEQALLRYSEFLKGAKDLENNQNKEKIQQDLKVEEDVRKQIATEKKEAEDTLRKEELTGKFNSAKAEVSSSIDSFKRSYTTFKETVTDISDSDKRSEWTTLHKEYQLLKKSLTNLAAIDHSQDITDITKTFVEKAETLYLDLQKWVLSELKNSPAKASSESARGTTKKEPVCLPRFQGDEKEDPYLQYPIWRVQWDKVIDTYEEPWRCTMLTTHIDKAALDQIVGFENNYVEAMKRLDLFYANPLKVISCVMNEVMAPPTIEEGDYVALVRYCNIISNNYNRLSNLKLEHEMSNTATMSLILRKFPRSHAEKWSESLASQEVDVKGKPFPYLVKWLSTQKEIWDGLIAAGFSSNGKSDPLNADVFYSQSDGCFGCGALDHKVRDCPDQKRNQQDRRDKPKPPRPPPEVKKHWCAFHKGDTTKRCSTISCQDLRKMADGAKRVELVKENGDCPHCCGDHAAKDCSRKSRICGGGQDHRGCSTTHNKHELFCAAAKVFHLQVQSHSTSTDSPRKDGVVLLIMTVRCRRGYMASTFYDNGCNCNFICESFAKKCGFKGREETLCVTTLGGVVTDYHKVITYSCSLKTVDGEWKDFEAYGMESITGALTTIEPAVIRKLFPNLDDHTINQLKRASKVDILIGICEASWIPVRTEPAKSSEGDLWLFKNDFGICVGGRHPMINDKTKKSDSLFHVNHTYHIDVSHPTDTNVSHELQFCPSRSAKYFNPKIQEVPSEITASAVPHLTAHEMNARSSAESTIHSSSSAVTISSTESTTPPHIPLPSSTSMLNPTAAPFSTRDTKRSLLPFISDISDVQDDFRTSVRKAVNSDCFAVKTAPLSEKDMFFQLESLGTFLEPQCGGCKCSNCPVPGSKYSFTQQKQYDTIDKNLNYDSICKCYRTIYPWLTARSALPKNEKQALQWLHSQEKSLSREPVLAEDVCEQIKAMIERRSARLVPKKELASWVGDYHYLAMVCVKGKKGKTRVCFDASRKQKGFPSMNMCLMKGPDRFINDLLSVILAFRNGRVGCAADIVKFHNQVRLQEEDVHMQRFLWRGMDTEAEPQTFAVTVNNFGVRAANSIATIALHKSADEFASVYPIESREVKEQTYVDDELTAASDMTEARIKTSRWDEICNHAGMPNKGWTFSGDEASDVELGSGGNNIVKVLGFRWIPKLDCFVFIVCVVLTVEQGGQRDITTVSELELLADQVILNRRVLLSNVKRIFDPAGLVAPFILPSKLLMRKTWTNDKNNPWQWDDPLPEDQRKEWISFLKLLLSLNELSIPRSLWPEGDIIGRPILVIFSDGSISAFGAAAYIRWQLVGGGYWSRLIMAKSKISPKNIMSIPRMELCGAVLGNRIKKFLVKETKFDFAKVYNLVDSSTVLGYLYKECGLFGPFEGVRVAEVQSSNEFEEGRLKNFAWVAGSDNPADWCTKPRTSTDIGKEFFYSGPPFLLEDEVNWPIKLTYRTEKLEGEVEQKAVFSAYVDTTFPDIVGKLAVLSSLWVRMVRVLAWILRLGSPAGPLTVDEIKQSKLVIVKHAQKEISGELSEAVESGTGRFRKLAPTLDDDGVWRVGSRMKNRVPFTRDSKMPKILPTQHRVTLLIMRFCHEFCHAGQDGTLSRFRMLGYWAVRAGVVAKSVKHHCVTCRKLSKILLQQPLGQFPDALLLNPTAWGYVQLDLLGPYSCRGDVNPRTTKKTWGMIIVDCNSGAVHLDIVQDYSTHAVLLSLRRFGSLRGWPGIICSDPGSQLESASGKLESWWVTMGDSLRTYGSTKNFKWEISPPDSPWRQGKAERLISIVKKQVNISVGDTRVTPVELQTIFMEVANMCNERPLGLSKPREDGSYNVITPNQLLLGRSTNVLPDDTELVDSLPMKARYRIVHHVTMTFWKQWASEVSPVLVNRPTWHTKGRNLCVNDVVLICHSTAIKGKYRLAVVEEVKVSDDGCVRSVLLRYAVVTKDNKSRVVRVRRSVQRLALILPVEEQSSPIDVREHDNYVQCCNALLN